MEGRAMTPEMILELERLVEKHERGHGQLTEAQADALRHAIALSAISPALVADRDRHANTSEVWRKRVHEAADALADALPGEVGRLDLVSRINELRRQMAARDRDLQLHFEAKNEALERVKELEARCARLSAAGQVLSEHVNKEPPITPDGWKTMGEEGGDAVLVPPSWTARDEFARAAMQGMAARIPMSEDPALITAVAYRMADAMLKARTIR
jgi:BMFP domain-containing protein YqiC